MKCPQLAGSVIIAAVAAASASHTAFRNSLGSISDNSLLNSAMKRSMQPRLMLAVLTAASNSLKLMLQAVPQAAVHMINTS